MKHIYCNRLLLFSDGYEVNQVQWIENSFLSQMVWSKIYWFTQLKKQQWQDIHIGIYIFMYII